jgi:hypothetical protein
MVRPVGPYSLTPYTTSVDVTLSGYRLALRVLEPNLCSLTNSWGGGASFVERSYAPPCRDRSVPPGRHSRMTPTIMVSVVHDD